MIKQYEIDHNPHRKNYYIVETQLRTSVRGREFQDRSKFRMAIIGMCLIFASLYIALYLGAFDFLVQPITQ